MRGGRNKKRDERRVAAEREKGIRERISLQRFGRRFLGSQFWLRLLAGWPKKQVPASQKQIHMSSVEMLTTGEMRSRLVEAGGGWSLALRDGRVTMGEQRHRGWVLDTQVARRDG